MQAVHGALPLIEVEQHRRTLGHRAEQVAEIAERVRANHVPVVRRDKQPRHALAGEDGEMILPEVRHHFLQLTLAAHGARELYRLQLAQRTLAATKLVAQLGVLLQHFGAEVLLSTRVATLREPGLRATQCLLARRIIGDDVARRAVEPFI